MSLLKSISFRHSQLHFHNALKPIVCHLTQCGSPYSTDYVPPTETSLPGRRHVYEPTYLDQLKPKFPPHELLDIEMKGYDFVVLERLQGLIHHLCSSLDVDVKDGWAVRAESWRVQRFVPKSSKAEAEFQLKEYKRVLQLSQLPSIKLPILIEMLQSMVPPGVTCSFVTHTLEMEKDRYIPDFESKVLRQQLEEMGGPSKLALSREREEHFVRK